MTIASVQHDCKVELREHELKATPIRLAVLKLLEKTDNPVDVESVIDYLKTQDVNADPVTAFRIMNMFTDKGLTKRIQLQEGKFRYELSDKEDHHHLVCTSCGMIDDISDCNISALEKEIEKKKQFTVTSHSLEFFGMCKMCKLEKSNKQ